MDVLDRNDLPFPQSLPEFQRLFPDDRTCAAYLERARWSSGFTCPHCHEAGEPFRIATRPGVLACRKCRRQMGLTAGTVMERSHIPLSTWFWAAYLVASQTPGISAVQFQRQLGLKRYETAFGILHKLRAGMVRPNQDRIGGQPGNHVEVDEALVGGKTRGEGRGVHHKTLVVGAVEVRHREPGTAQDKRKDGRYAGRVRLAVAADRARRLVVRVRPERRHAGIADRHRRLGRLWQPRSTGLRSSCHCRMRRSRGSRGVPADDPPRLLELEDLAQRYPSRC